MTNMDTRSDLTALVRRHVLEISEYKPGKTSNSPNAIRISANENNFGASAAVVRALVERLSSADFLNRYPDITCERLRAALSERHSLSADHFVVGNGLDDVITMLAMTFINEGDEVIVPAATFGVYEGTCGILGSKGVRVPMTDGLAIDIDGMIGALSKNTKMIWLCSPNNPTGTSVSKADLERLLDASAKLPRPPILIVDHAYADFTDPSSDAVDAFRYVRAGARVIALKTMSKLSGLAALRIGYAAGAPELMSFIWRVRPPYTVNALAEEAAIVDVADKEAARFKEDAKRSVASSRAELESFFKSAGVRYVPSDANFVFAFYDKGYEWASRLSSELAKRDIYVRTLRHSDAPSGIRFSIGTPEENEKLITSLKELIDTI